MKKLLPLLLLICCKLYSQEYVFGKVTTEQNLEIHDVLVINIRTDEKTYTNKDGNFMIAAKSTDLLRFVKEKFDRISYNIKPDDFQKSLSINMQKSAVEIEEVEIKTKLTGNLAKDTKTLNKSTKTLALNQQMNTYMKMKPEKPFPVLRTPSTFEKPSVNAAQLDFIKVFGFISKLIKGNKKTEFNPNPNTINGFLMKVRYSLTDNYFYDMGLKLEEIDDFLKFADRKLQLTKNYYNNFNLTKIQFQLESILEEYRKVKAS